MEDMAAGTVTHDDVQVEEEEDQHEKETETVAHDVHSRTEEIKIRRAGEGRRRAYAGIEEKPKRGEVVCWVVYELCSYFIQAALVPIVFPLIISQIVSHKRKINGQRTQITGLANLMWRSDACKPKEIGLYADLTDPLIVINTSNLSALEWTSISWFIGLIVAAPILYFVSIRLDHGRSQQLIAGVAIATGALFCLPAGFFKTTWIFPPYITAIIAAHTVALAAHTRHLGLMVRRFTGPPIDDRRFPDRRAVSGWLSLYATAAGCLGSVIISAFTYHMLQYKEKFISLWVISIFSGLKWLVGVVHVLSAQRPGRTDIDEDSISKAYALSVFKYPHAIGTLATVFLSSLTVMCIFTGGVLFLVGEMCVKPEFFLYFLLTYFIVPSVSLPLLHPLQHFMKSDAAKMKMLGFLLSAATAGAGFYFRRQTWHRGYILLFAAIQSTATGLLHAFGRVLVLDCAPPGSEGAFSVWFSWVRALGTCAGFAIASSVPGNISTSFGIGFWTAICGLVVLIFGNISDYGGAVAAGHLNVDKGEEEEEGSPVRALEGGRKGKDGEEEKSSLSEIESLYHN